MSAEERPYAAFVLSLVGGVLILLGGLVSFVWSGWFYWGGWWMGMMGPGMMGGWVPWFWIAFSAVGIVSGAVIPIAAYMLYNNPAQARLWGTVVLVFSITSLLSMGGFLVGALLGLVGGILALTWRKLT